jgi:hypothetical protein
VVPLVTLWLPILLSAVFVFVASSIIHMLLGYHRSDYQKLPDEDKFLSFLRPSAIKPGLYVFPHCTHKDMNSPALIEKQKQGPVGYMTVIPSGPPVMPKFLIEWFIYCLVIELFVAYLTVHTVPIGARYRFVFRVTGSASFLAYGLGHLSNGIWKGEPWSVTLKEVFDGLLYGLLTAGTFGWLWPR